MSTRPQIKPFPVIMNGDMSGNIVSVPTIVDNLTIYNYSFTWAGTSPVGTISIQASDDIKLLSNGQIDSNNPGSWNALPLSSGGSVVTTIPLSGNTGNGMIDVALGGFYAIRAVYTFTSGVGVLQGLMLAKVA